MNLQLVPALESDAEELVDLRIAAMRASLERIGRFDPERARERFLSGYSVQHTRHVTLDGLKVGFIVVKLVDDGLLLDHLYICPERQSAGIGKWALRQVFAEADQHGQQIRVGALKESDSNRFYTRRGFTLVEVAEWDNYYVRPARPV